MKKSVIASICLGVFIAFSVLCTLSATEEAISSGIIRLHVRANSNSREDQELKLKVRDRILAETGEMFASLDNKDKARTVAIAKLAELQRVAADEIHRQGYSYTVKVTFGKSPFPCKTYADICLPAGTYEAILVDIGSGQGDNWWCVMFPPLCFTGEACSEIPVDSRDMLIANMGSEAYTMIASSKPDIKFKLYELWQRLNDGEVIRP